MTIHDVLNLINGQNASHHALSKKVKGDRFEELIRRYFLTDKRYCNDIEEIWYWKNFPHKTSFSKDGRDIGIDLIVKSKGTAKYWAIQCKNFTKTRVDQKDVVGFLSTATKNWQSSFEICYFVTATNNISEKAREQFENRPFKAIIIDLRALESSQVNWKQIYEGNKGRHAQRKIAEPHNYQKTILAATKNYFSENKNNRGKLIMACGTGKTLTSLWIAEQKTNHQGFILFLVPSIALMEQSLEEWCNNSRKPLRYACICSDSTVDKGKNLKDETITKIGELPYPVTTDKNELVTRLRSIKSYGSDGMKVIFSTYQSLDVVIQAQKEFQKPFDLIICDEAHRTAANKYPRKEAHITDVHDDLKLKGHKRLYMTATPKIYKLNPKQESKAKQKNVAIYSMDDEEIFGQEIHRLGFGQAIEKKLLSDYRVIVFEYRKPDHVESSSSLKNDKSKEGSQLSKNYKTKLKACQDAINKVNIKKYLVDESEKDINYTDDQPMQRIVAFCPPSKSGQKNQAKSIAKYWNSLTNPKLTDTQKHLINDLRIKYVTGDMAAKDRKQVMRWLKGEIDLDLENAQFVKEKKNALIPEDQARIITNVRCLGEGVDVPNLDGIIYLSPRTSEIDIVQSIGRVLRTTKNKKYGYIIIPVEIDSYKNIDTKMRNNNYKIVWKILNALKAHDNRFALRVDQLSPQINPKKLADQILIGSDRLAVSDSIQVNEDRRQWFIPQLVRNIGNTYHWEDWAKDIAKIVEDYQQEIKNIVKNDPQRRQILNRLIKDLKKIINPDISEKDVIKFIAQHKISLPIFDTLFGDTAFTQQNQISKVLNKFLKDFQLPSFEQLKQLDGLYSDVKKRVSGIDDHSERIKGLKYSDNLQPIINELYQNFFQKGFQKEAQKHGVVYTPQEVVDFMIYSVNYIFSEEFGGRKLSDKRINIIDPFGGTGSFITRLIDSGLLGKNLKHKYKKELWLNEIDLLAYYIATISIENTYHKHQKSNQKYTPFNQSIWTDTFRLYELIKDKKNPLRIKNFFKEVVEKIKKQNQKNIQIIIGNPPYRKGQISANDDAQSSRYPIMDNDIKRKYTSTSTSRLARSLYDSYVRAYLWGGKSTRWRYCRLH